MSRLIVDHLTKSFGGIAAVRGVGFTVARGERLAMIGPNGAGKSTCFNMVGGQIRPDLGRVVLDDDDITGLPAHRVWAKGVGRTFQVATLFASMSVVENVQMALIRKAGRLRALWPEARRLHAREARDLLAAVGMADQADRSAGVLAYGDIKRVELAIALAHAPKLLLMDEPMAGMAPAEREALMTLTSAIVHERHIALLFTEHDMDVVFSHADRIIVLAEGRIIADGPPDAIADDPRVQSVYLGESAVAAP